MHKLVGLVGLFVFVGVCYLLSTDRKRIKWKPVIGGCLLQFLLATLILKTSTGQAVFEIAKEAVNHLFSFSLEGAKFVFGPLVNFEIMGKVLGPENSFLFVFQIPPTIIFVSSIMAVFYHLGLMQRVVYVFALVMQKILGTSGAESLSSAANVFMGQTEAPLVIRPYLERMTISEIMALMTGGMATVAGGVLAAYVNFGIDAGHLLAASVMSAPATLAISKILVPESAESETSGRVPLDLEKSDANLLDAACRGAQEGLYLSINVMGMLIAFIALMAMVNGFLGWITAPWLGHAVTMQEVLGYLFSPFAFFMGVPWDDVNAVGSLLGVKTVLNEFVAFFDLSRMTNISERSQVIATYALCGFANVASIGIQVGGIGSLVPSRRGDLARLGVRALIGGTLASFMTATIAGLLI